MAKPSTRELSDPHEFFLADMIGGRRMKGSGNQFNGQTDARNQPHTPFPIAIDGKSTLGRSMIIRLADWQKVVEQAGDLHPALGLRWYHDDRLRESTDLFVVSASFFSELLYLARESF
jgi:hypothetical protein